MWAKLRRRHRCLRWWPCERYVIVLALGGWRCGSREEGPGCAVWRSGRSLRRRPHTGGADAAAAARGWWAGEDEAAAGLAPRTLQPQPWGRRPSRSRSRRGSLRPRRWRPRSGNSSGWRSSHRSGSSRPPSSPALRRCKAHAVPCPNPQAAPPRSGRDPIPTPIQPHDSSPSPWAWSRSGWSRIADCAQRVEEGELLVRIRPRCPPFTAPRGRWRGCGWAGFGLGEGRRVGGSGLEGWDGETWWVRGRRFHLTAVRAHGLGTGGLADAGGLSALWQGSVPCFPDFC